MSKLPKKLQHRIDQRREVDALRRLKTFEAETDFVWGNNLLDIFEQLKKKFKGNFIISNAVKKEVIDHPMKTRKYKLEAIMISDLIQNNILKTKF